MPHIHEKFDYAVSAVLVHKDKTLFIKHKYLPVWTPPAGHVELNQTPIDALYVEIAEEAGILPPHLNIISPYTSNMDFLLGEHEQSLPVPFDINVHAITKTHSHIDFAYIVISDTDIVTPGVGESKQWQWMTREMVMNFQEITPAIRSRALFALDYISKNYPD